MALAEIGEMLSSAIKQMNNALVVDDRVVNICLDEMSSVLLQADVNSTIVSHFQNKIKTTIRDHLIAIADNNNKLIFIKQAIFDELCNMLDAGVEISTPSRTHCMVMFFGLPGSGKSKTCGEYANHYQKKGWRPAIIDLSDPQRSSLDDKLMRKAEDAKEIPIYGCCMESNHEKVIFKAIKIFRDWFRDVVIVDTNNYYTDEDTHFRDMIKVSQVMLDLHGSYLCAAILVMDCSIGQAAFDQVQAFKKSFPNGSVILTKMDVHKTSVGALSAVAAAKVPVVFVERGEEHLDKLEVFDIKPFLSHLLGLGDEIKFEDRNLASFNHMHEEGLRYNQEKCERFKTILGLMRTEGLDVYNPNILSSSCILKIAEGCGYQAEEVQRILEEYKRGFENYQQILKDHS